MYIYIFSPKELLKSSKYFLFSLYPDGSETVTPYALAALLIKARGLLITIFNISRIFKFQNSSQTNFLTKSIRFARLDLYQMSSTQFLSGGIFSDIRLQCQILICSAVINSSCRLIQLLKLSVFPLLKNNGKGHDRCNCISTDGCISQICFDLQFNQYQHSAFSLLQL